MGRTDMEITSYQSPYKLGLDVPKADFSRARPLAADSRAVVGVVRGQVRSALHPERDSSRVAREYPRYISSGVSVLSEHFYGSHGFIYFYGATCRLVV